MTAPVGRAPDRDLVVIAEAALRTFRVTTRTDARRLLPLWRWYPELTTLEEAAVIARFDVLPEGPAPGGAS